MILIVGDSVGPAEPVLACLPQPVIATAPS